MNSYPKIYNVGHPALDGFFDEPVDVEEKVDGSQFSFWLDEDTVQFHSKRVEIYPEAAGMFDAGVQHILSIQDRLATGFVYRGEYLRKPKHNALTYDRVPNGHVILFDVMTDPERYLERDQLVHHASILGLEVVPRLFAGKVDRPAMVQEWLEQKSVLGGQIEGLVFKRRVGTPWGRDGKALIAKHVCEKFREVHQGKKFKVPKQDTINAIVEHYRTEARWRKAVEHLRDEGKLENSPRDIGALIKEAQEDLVAECHAEIKALLFNSFKKQILRGAVRGLPEWYKDQLLQGQFKWVSDED